MRQSVLSVRVEEDVKRSFDSFCDDVGLNPSVAINMFIKATLKQKRIPFEISSGYNPFHSNANTSRLITAARDAEQGKNMIIKTFDELEGMEDD